MNDERNSSPGFFASLMKFVWNTLGVLFWVTLISAGVFVTVRNSFVMSEKNCQRKILGDWPDADDKATLGMLTEMSYPDDELEGKYFVSVEEMKNGKILALTKENCYVRLFGGSEHVVPLIRELVKERHKEWKKSQEQQEQIDALKQELEQLKRSIGR